MKASDRRVFDLLVKAACEGERCPTNDVLGGVRTSSLARGGFIRVEVYAQNYRVVEIRSGEHTGKRTAEDPKRGKPYRVVDANGDQWLGWKAGGKSADQPSVRHVDRSIDRDHPKPSITLAPLKFLDDEVNS